MISTSEIRITVLIDEKDTEKAMIAIHDGFGLNVKKQKNKEIPFPLVRLGDYLSFRNPRTI